MNVQGIKFNNKLIKYNTKKKKKNIISIDYIISSYYYSFFFYFRYAIRTVTIEAWNY